MAEDMELYHESALGQLDGAERPTYGDPEDGGDLLEMEDADLIELLQTRWDSQTEILRPLINQWTVNALRRKGIPGVRLKSGDTGEIYIPKNAASADAVPSLNKLADTLRRLAAMLFSDPPASQAIPHSDSNEDKDAAETATQILEEIDGESQLDDAHTAERAFDRGSDYGSGFVYYWVDPKGGPRVPLEIEAGFDPGNPGLQLPPREAMTVDDAVWDPTFPGMEIEWPKYRSRFVRPDGTLTEERSEAATQWTPKIKSRIYTSRNVRLLPISSRDLWDADGVLITDFPSWQEVLKENPELVELPKDDRDAILSAKPKNYKDIMTAAEIRAINAKAKEDRPVWRLRCYFKHCPEYPQGAHVVILGGKVVVTKDPWVATNADDTIEHLDIPLTQYGQLEEGGRGMSYKVGMGEILGGGNEMRTYIWSQIIHNLERIRNQKTLLPSMGKIHTKQLQMGGRGNILPFQPGYKPEYEQVPTLPSVVLEAFEMISTEMDHASMLEQAALGVQDPSVTSGRHAFAIISQVKQGLSTLIQNIERGWVRGGRIKLQLIRAFYTKEQQLLWSSDDDDWKVKSWRRADLASTRDVRLKTGTLTMWSPAQKEAMAFEWHGAGLIDDQRLHEIVAANMGATLGIQQDVRRSRIKGQLNRWLEGPPSDWTPPAIAMQPVMMQSIDPMGQPVMTPVVDETPGPFGTVIPQPRMEPALDPGGKPLFEPDRILQGIFEPVPADVVPRTAQLRFDLICETMNSKKYLEMHPAWRSALDQEYYRMQQAVAAAQMMAQTQPQPAERKPETPRSETGYTEQAASAAA